MLHTWHCRVAHVIRSQSWSGDLADVILSAVAALGSVGLLLLQLKRKCSDGDSRGARCVCVVVWLLLLTLASVRTLLADDNTQQVSLAISQLLVCAMFVTCATSPLGGKMAALLCTGAAVAYLIVCYASLSLRENQVYNRDEELIVSPVSPTHNGLLKSLFLCRSESRPARASRFPSSLASSSGVC